MPQIHDLHHIAAAFRTHLSDEAATLAFGARLAAALPARLTIHLAGDLGAGKTTLTRGVLRGLGFGGRVKSPTYTLVEAYKDSRITLYHFDFYRFAYADEFLEAGLDEYFEGEALRLVEWPAKAAPHLAPPDLELRLSVAPDGDGRELELVPLTDEGHACIARLAPPPPP